MPPKKAPAKGAKAAGAAAKGKAGAGDAATVSASTLAAVKDLEEIHDLLDKEQELRRYFQLERDKVQEFYDVSRKELDNANSNALNIESSIEEQEKRHQVEVKVYQQKIRHLVYERKLQLQAIKAENDQQLQAAADAHRHTIEEQLREKQALFQMDVGVGKVHDKAVSEAQDAHRYMIQITKPQSHEKDRARLEAMYEAKLKALEEDLEMRRCAEIQNEEERKNEHINELIRLHEQKFADTKSYYNQITMNNLEIIKSLKEEIANLKKHDEQNEALLYDIEKENSNLKDPLERAKEAVAELQQQLKLFEKDKRSLKAAQGQMRMLTSRLREKEDDYATLERNYNEVFGEREKLKANFEGALVQAMEVMDERNEVLHQSLMEANANVEERDAQLASVLQAVNIEPAALPILAEEVERNLSAKNTTIKNLQFELAKLKDNHRAVLQEYERRCREGNIPSLQLA